MLYEYRLQYSCDAYSIGEGAAQLIVVSETPSGIGASFVDTVATYLNGFNPWDVGYEAYLDRGRIQRNALRADGVIIMTWIDVF